MEAILREPTGARGIVNRPMTISSATDAAAKVAAATET